MTASPECFSLMPNNSRLGAEGHAKRESAPNGSGPRHDS